MARQSETIDAHVYRWPAPAKVAALIDAEGFDAACERWFFVGSRTLLTMARTHRRSQDQGSAVTRPRSYDDLTAAVIVEASAILGSATAGERAAGVSKAVGASAHTARGLKSPAISIAARGALASLGRRANHGDADAVAEREAIHEHERAVGAVLRVALALVPSQPSTGRYRLPAADDALRTALAGLDPAAIEAVFPGLIQTPSPAPAAAAVPEEPAVAEHVPPAPEPAVEAEPACLPFRRVPSDSVIRGDHAGGGTLVAIAEAYGVRPASLYTHWCRLGLSARGRLAGYETSSQRTAREAAAPAVETPPPPEPVPAVEPQPVPPVAPGPAPRPAPVFLAPRLDIEDLVRAVELSRRTGMPSGSALRWVREDLAMARAEEAMEAAARAYEANARNRTEVDALFASLRDEGPRQ